VQALFSEDGQFWILHQSYIIHSHYVDVQLYEFVQLCKYFSVYSLLFAQLLVKVYSVEVKDDDL